MNTKQPAWLTTLLYAILIGGSLVFLLPYMWLLGTSWKLDKEVQSEDINIFPLGPVARTVSPYVDERTYGEIERPEEVGRHRWDGWMRAAAIDEIGKAVDAWSDPRTEGLAKDVLRNELIEGVFRSVKGRLPLEMWQADETTFRAAVHDSVQNQLIDDAFEQSYRYFALSQLLLKDHNYRIYNMSEGMAIDEFWKPTGGGAMAVEARQEADRDIAVVHYDLSSDENFEMTAEFKLPDDIREFERDFKRVSVSFRRDQTWHELRTFIEINGTLYKSASPKYLGEDNFWEASFQLPSEDDKRLIPKHYILLDKIDSGKQFDHGKNVMRLRVAVQRSATPEAYWAKGTENYREVFAEVPFWRYLSTSAFLALANIIGTCFSCSLAAYAFARLQWPGRDFCFVLVLATLMIPPQITMIPSFVIYKQLGWYNTLAPLWVPACLAINAFGIFLLRQAMKGIPRDLEDAAKIDGCGYFRTYWHVALPLMRPTLAAISVFTFMYVWNDFMGPLIYVNDQRLYPLALGLFSFLAGRENQFTLIMAGSVIMTIPVIVTFFVLQRYFIQGVALSGMKN